MSLQKTVTWTPEELNALGWFKRDVIVEPTDPPPSNSKSQVIMHAPGNKSIPDAAMANLPGDIITLPLGDNSWEFWNVDKTFAPFDLSLPQNKKYLFSIFSKVNPPSLWDATYWNKWITKLESAVISSAQSGFAGLMVDYELYYPLSEAHILKDKNGKPILDDKGNKQRDWPMDFLRYNRERPRTDAEITEKFIELGRRMGQILNKHMPNAIFLTLHGLESGVPDGSPNPPGIGNQEWAISQGYFGYGALYTGLLLGCPNVQIISGGQMFNLRTTDDYQDYAKWALSTAIDTSVGIPQEYKKLVREKVQLGAMVGDFAHKNWKTNQISPMDPGRYESTLKAIKAAGIKYPIAYLQESKAVWTGQNNAYVEATRKASL
jgi:hypothetical protein